MFCAKPFNPGILLIITVFVPIFYYFQTMIVICHAFNMWYSSKYIYAYIYIYIYIYVSVYICIWICTYALCMCMCMHMHMHIPISLLEEAHGLCLGFVHWDDRNIHPSMYTNWFSLEWVH